MSSRKFLGALCILFGVIVIVLSGLLLHLNGLPGSGTSRAAGSTPSADFTQYKSGKTRAFTLYVRSTTVMMPDGTKIFAFGYTDDPTGEAKIPGPPIVVDQGDQVNVTLIDDKDPTKTQFNTEGDGHTIHLHGLDVPSAMDGDPMTSPSGTSVKQGTKYTYSFIAHDPGTYWYHCHEGAAEHIQMGMYGPLVVRPHGEANRAYTGTPTFDKEYTMVLSEMDSAMHSTDYQGLYKGGDDPNWSQYHPNYFLMNGKAFPDTMKDPRTNVELTVGQTVLIRLINAGYTVHTIHSHGFHFEVIGSDGRKLASPYSKDSLDIGPGERYDILMKVDMAGRYMFHDHNESATTNNGSYPGGMITMINVNNKDGSNPVSMDLMMKAIENS